MRLITVTNYRCLKWNSLRDYVVKSKVIKKSFKSSCVLGTLALLQASFSASAVEQDFEPGHPAACIYINHSQAHS